MIVDKNGIVFLERDDIVTVGLLVTILNTLQQGTSDAISDLRRDMED